MSAETGLSNTKSIVLDFFHSSIGAKVMMAVTGLIMWGFVLMHVLGNLQVLFPDNGSAINHYAKLLHSVGELIWVARIVLLVTIVIHVFFGIRLARMNRKARRTRYLMQVSRKTSLFAKIMPYSGLVVLAFIVFHLAHFTAGVIPSLPIPPPNGDLPNVYRMVWDAFRRPEIVAIYVLGNTLLLAHLYHGSVSLFQSLGLSHKTWTPAIRLLGRLIALFITLGNIAIPLVLYISWMQAR